MKNQPVTLKTCIVWKRDQLRTHLKNSFLWDSFAQWLQEHDPIYLRDEWIADYYKMQGGSYTQKGQKKSKGEQLGKKITDNQKYQYNETQKCISIYMVNRQNEMQSTFRKKIFSHFTTMTASRLAETRPREKRTETQPPREGRDQVLVGGSDVVGSESNCRANVPLSVSFTFNEPVLCCLY